eukprot:XP_001704880.1 Hypothetical protein GL50803_93541 [Giardia lamblia ATCC 50803]
MVDVWAARLGTMFLRHTLAQSAWITVLFAAPPLPVAHVLQDTSYQRATGYPAALRVSKIALNVSKQALRLLSVLTVHQVTISLEHNVLNAWPTVSYVKGNIIAPCVHKDSI